MSRSKRPDVELELSRLKDFQRATVDRVHERFYGRDPVRRFLVADEVGLGKTLVARGVIARTIDHLWNRVDRIDIVYICSNNQIARQNLNRLRVGASQEIQHADRLTMLPRAIGSLQQQKVNFISFTPGTSFNLRGNGGKAGERVLLFRLLADGIDLNFGARRWTRFFSGGSGLENFERQLRWYDQNERKQIPQEMIDAFADAVLGASTDAGFPLLDALQECAEGFNYLRQGSRVAHAISSERYRLIGQLRELVAQASVDKLEPDLVILDEFQRFKSLMNPQEPGSELAHALFNHNEARLLLLSATPYKMYTLPDDPEGDDHYADFTRTVEFLAGSDRAREIDSALSSVRQGLYSGDHDAAIQAKDAAQAGLRRVMARTERLATTPDRDGMIRECLLPGVALEPDDVREFVGNVAVSKAIDQRQDLLEYWRSSPYLFEFMDEYKIKKALQQAAGRSNTGLASAFQSTRGRLTWQSFAGYDELDPRNAKLRGLLTDVLDRGAWQIAWIPPSLPYYELRGPYANPALRTFTKRLIFSSWTVVPKTIAAMVSYEAERRLTRASPTSDRAYDAARPTPLLTFQVDHGRLAGMPVLGILYPSEALADSGDPVAIAKEQGETFPMSRKVYRSAVSSRIRGLLDTLPRGSASGQVDDRWYWAAPFLLDHLARPPLAHEDLAWPATSSADDGASSRFFEHVDEAMNLDPSTLGRRPKDLITVLTDIAVAGPGVVALRALSRLIPEPEDRTSSAMRRGAAAIAWSLRSYLNRPEIMALVRAAGSESEAYWRLVLKHADDGCLQAVMDEHLHVLFEAVGLFDKPLEEQTQQLADAVASALTLRSSNSSIHFFECSGSRVTIDDKHHLRSHFAVRFGRSTTDDTKDVQRESQVRDAYNSPYWPFVLASTSVGQEGLDFHLYSHAIVHWNLPGNPVDLEQREGRVHRYKGHAVRKNISTRYGARPEIVEATDPWSRMFELASDDRPEGATEIYPYWVFPLKEGAAIERYTPVMPMSKESHALRRLMRTVGAYRLVVGQPRQDDLLRYLGDKATEFTDVRIDLSPSGGED